MKRGNLLMQMGDKDGAGKDMKRYLELNLPKDKSCGYRGSYR